MGSVGYYAGVNREKHIVKACKAETDIYLCYYFIPGFHKVIEGIDKAIAMGYNPVKVFCLFYLFLNFPFVSALKNSWGFY